MKGAAQVVDKLLETDIDPKDELSRIRSEDPHFGGPDVSKLDVFTRGYIEALFFTDEERLREEIGSDDTLEIDPNSLWQIIQDCEKFQKDNWDDLGTDIRQAGIDFWFTRQGHGVGFWDGDWPEPQATRLTDASKAYKQTDTYVGDDGAVYIS